MLCSDLFFASQIDGAARVANVSTQLVDDDASAITASRTPQVRLVIVDLENPGLDLETLVEQLGPNRPKLLGFYPHVRKDRLAAAEAVGFNEVISGGQFSTQLVEILRSVRT